MRELSLFSGAGGGLLATHHLLGWRTVGYVEFSPYCQRVLAQRIRDGYLSDAPIFSDIRAFLSEGYADSYQGMVDVVTAGFPCQPFSQAGKRLAGDDERNMWPATRDVLRRVQPRYALLENVPGLRARRHNYLEQILKELAESGYDCRWDCLSASAIGAPHRRDRLFLVAYAALAHAKKLLCNGRHVHGECGGEGADSLSELGNRSGNANLAVTGSQGLAPSKCKAIQREGGRHEGGAATECGWWSAEPPMGRVAHGVAHRVDRLRALGNGQVPRVVASAWRLLSEL